MKWDSEVTGAEGARQWEEQDSSASMGHGAKNISAGCFSPIEDDLTGRVSHHALFPGRALLLKANVLSNCLGHSSCGVCVFYSIYLRPGETRSVVCF